MNRRGFLRLLGLAPVAAVVGINADASSANLLLNSQVEIIGIDGGSAAGSLTAAFLTDGESWRPIAARPDQLHRLARWTFSREEIERGMFA